MDTEAASTSPGEHCFEQSSCPLTANGTGCTQSGRKFSVAKQRRGRLPPCRLGPSRRRVLPKCLSERRSRRFGLMGSPCFGRRDLSAANPPNIFSSGKDRYDCQNEQAVIGERPSTWRTRAWAGRLTPSMIDALTFTQDERNAAEKLGEPFWSRMA